MTSSLERLSRISALVERIRGALQCMLCGEVLSNPYRVRSCNHNFCAECVKEELLERTRCPACELPTIPKDLEQNKQLRNLLAGFTRLQDESVRLLKAARSSAEKEHSRDLDENAADEGIGSFDDTEAAAITVQDDGLQNVIATKGSGPPKEADVHNGLGGDAMVIFSGSSNEVLRNGDAAVIHGEGSRISSPVAEAEITRVAKADTSEGNACSTHEVNLAVSRRASEAGSDVSRKRKAHTEASSALVQKKVSSDAQNDVVQNNMLSIGYVDEENDQREKGSAGSEDTAPTDGEDIRDDDEIVDGPAELEKQQKSASVPNVHQSPPSKDDADDASRTELQSHFKNKRIDTDLKSIPCEKAWKAVSSIRLPLPWNISGSAHGSKLLCSHKLCSAAGNKVVIALTNVRNPQRDCLLAMAEHLGAETVEDLDEMHRVTHLVSGVTRRNEIIFHTMKLMMAVAGHRWVLRDDWLRTSAHEGSWQDEADFAPVDRDYNCRRTESLPFLDKHICFHGGFDPPGPTLDQLRLLAIQGGGTVETCSDSKQLRSTMAVLDEATYERRSELNIHSCQRVLSSQSFLDAVLEQRGSKLNRTAGDL